MSSVKTQRLNGDHDVGIIIGMAIAAALLTRDMDKPSLALEVLGAAGLDDRKSLSSLELDDYDLAPLLRIVKR